MSVNRICTVALMVLFTYSGGIAALECFNCQNTGDPRACNATIICNVDESCYQDSGLSSASKTVSLGCVANQQCTVASSNTGTLVGRDITKRQTKGCHECCATDRCNDNLCTRRNPNWCIDDETVNCPKLNSVFGVCNDTQHAKLLCPKFCRLCEVVDGDWSEWSPWSTCDVTCENGTKSRSRTCTKPAPAHGGLDCVGNNMESKQCYKQPCPVHGGWTEWTPWGSCSASCGIGIQRRQRYCSNPQPQRFGDHCFGLSLDDRLCMPGPCSNGGWSDWGSWSSCSVTCGDGFHSRSRTCTNPRPSPFGRDCEGDPMQVVSCAHNICQDSGGTTIAFRSKNITDTSVSTGDIFVFGTTSLNEGNSYNATSGIFTAPVDGAYSFSVQICSRAMHYGMYGIFVDNVELKASSYGDSGWISCHTADTVAVLKKGDRIWVQCTSGPCSLRKDDTMYWNTFSGVLVHL